MPTTLAFAPLMVPYWVIMDGGRNIQFGDAVKASAVSELRYMRMDDSYEGLHLVETTINAFDVVGPVGIAGQKLIRAELARLVKVRQDGGELDAVRLIELQDILHR